MGSGAGAEQAGDRPVARRDRDERGAAAVEGALVLSFVVLPLLLGVIWLGNHFWIAQRVDAITPGIPTGGVAGTFGCQQLKDEVAATVVDVVQGLDPALAGVDLSDVTVTVVEILPEVGVDVRVRIETGVLNGLADLFPLPGGGSLVTDFTQRLTDVRLDTLVCR